MKKSLVLAMAMALGVTASAYAANPFSDVPAGHWAYDSVAELAAAGVVDGYTDGSFGGDKLMTRYEMAQIVAKAMAKGANVDKLAAEFADELDTLGVRVANLEKKADNVKITGEVRYRYTDSELNGFTNDLRTRLWVNGQINDDWSYTGMLENTQDFGNDNGEEDTEFKRAYVNGKLGGLRVTAGRYNALIAQGNIFDANVDGVEAVYGDKVQLRGFVGKGTDAVAYDTINEVYIPATYGDYAGGELKADLSDNLSLNGGYVSFKDIASIQGLTKSGVDNKIWHIGAEYSVGDVTVSGMYLHGDTSRKTPIQQEADKDGYMVGVSYKGAEAAEVGSYGLWANYYDQGGQTVIVHTSDANTFGRLGFEGYGVGANYTFAKNIVGTLAYYDTESKAKTGKYKDKDDQILWTSLTFSF